MWIFVDLFVNIVQFCGDGDADDDWDDIDWGKLQEKVMALRKKVQKLAKAEQIEKDRKPVYFRVLFKKGKDKKFVEWCTKDYESALEDVLVYL